MTDATGHCERGEHERCDGTLLTATGWHWWCACPCHPVPTPAPGTPPLDVRKAMTIWRAANEANKGIK